MTTFAIIASILGVLAVILLYVVSVYNGLITLRNRYKNAFSQVDVQLKRRYDLIPNLVETAKGYMKHEASTLEAVVQARNIAMAAGQSAAANPGDPSTLAPLERAEGALTGALSRLMVVMEAYPELKANQNMMLLQEELASTENKVAFARQGYNDAVTVFNIRRETFPANIVAGMFGFLQAALFEVDTQEERQAPKVSF